MEHPGADWFLLQNACEDMNDHPKADRKGHPRGRACARARAGACAGGRACARAGACAGACGRGCACAGGRAGASACGCVRARRVRELARACANAGERGRGAHPARRVRATRRIHTGPSQVRPYLLWRACWFYALMWFPRVWIVRSAGCRFSRPPLPPRRADLRAIQSRPRKTLDNQRTPM